ncbi:MAG: exodeoxyribonuclease VII large subunit, partial [Chloroflexi bacterium]|nr:exodeoxyribonuclease VII large subunit [Chloroflexota bacterium]
MLRRTQLAAAQAGLQAMNPNAVLNRGYAAIQDAQTGRTLVKAEQAHQGQQVIIRLQDGDLGAEITRVAKDSR